MSIPLFEEVSHVFHRPMILWQTHAQPNEIEEFLGVLNENCFGEEPYPEIDPLLVDDPDDLMVLQTALVSNADFIVSGDHHLLDLRQFRGIPIVTPREFLEMLPPSE